MHRDKIHSDLENTFIISLLILLLGLVFTSIAGRLLGPEEFGLLQLGRRTVTYLFPLLFFGLNTALVREVSFAKNEWEKSQIAQVAIWVAFPSIMFALFLVVYPSVSLNKLLFGRVPDVPSAFGLLLLSTLIFTFIYSQLRAFQKLKAANLLLLFTMGVSPLIAVGALFWRDLSGSSLMLLISIMMLVTLMPIVIFFCVKLLKRQGNTKEKSIKDFANHFSLLIRYGITRSIVPLLLGVIYTAGAMSLNKHGEAVASGVFLAQLFFLRIIDQAVGPFAIVMLPKLSSLVGGGAHEQVQRYTQGVVDVLLPIGLSITAGLLIVGKEVNELFYGIQYLEGNETLVILSLAVLPVMFFSLGQTILDALTSKGIVALTALAGAFWTIICISLNTNPTLEGTAYIFVTSIWIVSILMLVALMYEFTIKVTVREACGYILVAISIAVAARAVLFLCKPVMPLVLAVGVSVLFCSGVFILLSRLYKFKWVAMFNLSGFYSPPLGAKE